MVTGKTAHLPSVFSFYSAPWFAGMTWLHLNQSSVESCVVVRWKQTNLFLSPSLSLSSGCSGFSVSTANRVHVFKPVSVQAMWWAALLLMTLECVTLCLSPVPPLWLRPPAFYLYVSLFFIVLLLFLFVVIICQPSSHSFFIFPQLTGRDYILMSAPLSSFSSLCSFARVTWAPSQNNIFWCLLISEVIFVYKVGSLLFFFCCPFLPLSCSHYYIFSNRISRDDMIDRLLIIMGEYLIIVIVWWSDQKVLSDAGSLDSLIYYLVLSLSSSLSFSLSLLSCFCFKNQKFLYVRSFWHLFFSFLFLPIIISFPKWLWRI